MKKTIILTVTLLAATVANAAGPKQELADTLHSYQLETVQVVSTRAAKKTPIAFTNISGEVLQQQNTGRDIPFLLLQTPSVVVTTDAGNGIGYTSLRIRGTDASRINITTNGILGKHGRLCIKS